MKGKEEEITQTRNGIIEEIRILGKTKDFSTVDFACWYDKFVFPTPMAFSFKDNYLSLTAREGEELKTSVVKNI